MPGAELKAANLGRGRGGFFLLFVSPGLGALAALCVCCCFLGGRCGDLGSIGGFFRSVWLKIDGAAWLCGVESAKLTTCLWHSPGGGMRTGGPF